MKANPDSHWKKLKLLISGLVSFKRQDAVSMNDPEQILAQIKRIKRRKSERRAHSSIKDAKDVRGRGASPTRADDHRFLANPPEADSFEIMRKKVNYRGFE